MHLKFKNSLFALLGSAILAFGLYNVHSMAGVTEGGLLGLTLLLQHWLSISPALSGLILNAVCYLMGWRALGKNFVGYSAIACGGFSLFYAIFERFDPLWPELAQHPLAAAILGAIFVGVGVGISVRAGGAPGGDDALAMAVSQWTGLGMQWIYLISDLVVLALSISYLPVKQLACSLLTVILSGQLIGWIQRIKLPGKDAPSQR